MTIRTEIMRVDNTPEPLASEIGRRNREIFPDVGPDAIDTRGIQWAPGEWCVVVYNNDEFGAYAEVLQREILVGGQPVTVGVHFCADVICQCPHSGFTEAHPAHVWQGHHTANAADCYRLPTHEDFALQYLCIG
ncbi:MAG: hypothetical protein AAF653_15720, partial [Chloroflexota bacterium]